MGSNGQSGNESFSSCVVTRFLPANFPVLCARMQPLIWVVASCNPADVADQFLQARPGNGIDARTSSCADYGIWPKAALPANAHKMTTIAASPVSSGLANAGAARSSRKNLPARLLQHQALPSSASPVESSPVPAALAAPVAARRRFLLRERWCEWFAGIF